MRVLLLGTGGADGIPALYGSDRVSEHARLVRGKNIRSRAAALIDNQIKIDLGPDTVSQIQREGLNAADWSSLFITHTDEDHLCLSEIQYGMFPFIDSEKLEFTIYGNPIVCEMIRHRYPEWPIDLVELHKYQPVTHEQYVVTPIHATHKPDEECHNFIFEREGRSFLYATDTGVYSEEVFGFLAGRQLDALVVECSDGIEKSPYMGHMDVVQCVETVQRLRREGGLREGARVVTTHHTAGGKATHEELEEILGPYDIQVGYDGLSFEV
ncbi:MAG TPA: MBL fold metallo-hydrolase [Fimbriimonas sp.]|nr:MBL fold metallo-hydrolase [Fimbriimonas sp.]